MSFKKRVERWRELVRSELSKAKIPLPEDLILAVIDVESDGQPGLQNPKSGASGLMQVMPKTLQWYNQQTGSNIPLSWLRSDSHPAEQIRTGIWVLGQFWRGAYNYLSNRVSEIPTDELAKIADLFYVAGPGATRRRLDKLEIPFFSYVEQRFPSWNALPHPRNVWKALPSAVQWDTAGISNWLGKAEKIVKRAREGAIFSILAIFVGYWLFLRKK